MKYIILKGTHDHLGIERLYPVIFPEYMTHCVVAHGVQNAFFKEEDAVLEVHSAGFCNIHYTDQEWTATRGSESLGIKRGAFNDDYDDAKILNMPDALQGLRL